LEIAASLALLAMTPVPLLGHLLDVEVVLGVGDFDAFFAEALVYLAVETVEYAAT